MNIILKPIDEPKEDLTFYKYAWVIYLLWLLFGLGHLAFVNRDYIEIKIWAPFVLLGKSVYNLYAHKKKVRDLVIDESGITGVFEGFESREKVFWTEIRSVRFEDSLIVLYIESSLQRVIELDQFEKNDQAIIVNKISEVVSERRLEFFNASSAALH